MNMEYMNTVSSKLFHYNSGSMFIDVVLLEVELPPEFWVFYILFIHLPVNFVLCEWD